MVASIIKTLIKNCKQLLFLYLSTGFSNSNPDSPRAAVPPDASDKHFNYVSRTKYNTTKVRFQTNNNIAANENTLAKIYIELIKADAEAATVRTATTTAATTAMMRSAATLAFPFLATGLTA
jgi:hypothetical protein